MPLDGHRRPQPPVRLTVAPQARLLGTVRLVVATAARRAGLDDELVEDLKLAVTEVCAAAVRDGDTDPGAIEVELGERGGRFVVEIRDPGPLLDPAGDREFSLALAGSLVSGLESGERPEGGYVTRFWLPTEPPEATSDPS
jgi:anti-sigma regulatory factor (Ser/Thr protein kinase)